MSNLILKLCLSLFYFLLSLFSLVNPVAIRNYVDTRFQGFHQFAFTHSVIASYITRDFIRKIPMHNYKILTVLFTLAGFAILMEHRVVIMGFAYLLMGIGGALHMPYATQQLSTRIVSQIKRLVFVFTIFCGMMSIANGSIELQKIPEGA